MVMNMENGLLTKQLVSKVTLMMKDRVFGHGTTTSLAVQKVSGSPSYEKKKVNEKALAQVDSKELVRDTLVKNKHEILNGGRKKVVLGGQREKEARKVLRKVKKAFRKVVVAPTNQKKV